MPILSRRSFLTFFSTIASVAACKTAGGSHSLSGEENEFDYIVVGSGAGGGPLAVNLARAGFQTLLIEAGSDQGTRDIYKIPAFHTHTSEDSEMSWDFFVKHFQNGELDAQDRNFIKDKGILYPRAGTLSVA